jgi:hypothetical protein
VLSQICGNLGRNTLFPAVLHPRSRPAAASAVRDPQKGCGRISGKV